MSQWRDEWELRILVVASLSAQYLLALIVCVHNFHVPPWLRFSFWLAQIGSDALAIFALATLFNYRRNGPSCSYAPGRRDLELLLAPILLMHLGGQVVITSYKIEDNERSTQYILTSLSKVTVALFVFYKTWSSNDKKLLAATVLLFIAVIIRCFQKALALKRTSFNALPKPNSSEVNFGGQFEHLLRFIEQAKEGMDRAQTQRTQGGIPRLPCQLFLDIPCSYFDRLMRLIDFWCLDRESAYGAIEGALSDMTSLLYTKNIAPIEELYLDFKNAPNIIRIMFKQQLVIATFSIAMSLAFASHRKDPHPHKDTIFTFCMLQGTVLLEVVYMLVQVLLHKALHVENHRWMVTVQGLARQFLAHGAQQFVQGAHEGHLMRVLFSGTWPQIYTFTGPPHLLMIMKQKDVVGNRLRRTRGPTRRRDDTAMRERSYTDNM